MRKTFVVAALVVFAVAVFYFLVGSDLDSPAQRADSNRVDPPVVAVLPFDSSSEEGDGKFFANGVHDDLLTQLAQLQAFRVISRTSVLDYQDGNKNMRDIGRELGADAILEGRVQSIGDQIRINVQLIDASTDEHLWAQTYDRALTLENLFAVQSEIARSVAAAMRTTLTTEDTAELAVLPTQNMAAYRAFHQAMVIRDSLGVSDPAYIVALEKAVAIDPEFTKAWAELAGILSFQSFSEPDPESILRVEQILERIRLLAPDSADHLVAQAYYTYYLLKDYDKAFQLISLAQAKRPSDVRVLELKGLIQRRQGDFAGRVETIRLTRSLDPRNPIWTTILVWNLVISHRYDEASRVIETAAVSTYPLSVTASWLRLRTDRDINRWAAEVRALQDEYPEANSQTDAWEVLIATRDFIAAEKLVHAIEDYSAIDPGFSVNDISSKDFHKVFTYWLLNREDQLSDPLSRIRERLAESRNPDGGMERIELILISALVAAAEGNNLEAARLIRQWQREVPQDLAALANQRHFACRILGMVAATAAAVACIRTSLEEPSWAAPFWEPYLPYYDAIRDQPEFVQLLTDSETSVQE